ncbi:alpha/beta hydrolase [Labrenzia sp. 011]|uniref:alpha/beta fold hydrolase n=1 Tax=Labrenzia sp. 011 TaxID=2171494 RepID=UPI000D50B305|nr:alpha/beta hydrolase [Labrenzia sp. 011]PVB59499.1 hypothetical protein DCO57_22055 [Labrenzia sp. 011]
MPSRSKLGLLFLHALPLDGSMWAGQGKLLPNSTYTPTLYSLGASVEDWAASALRQVREERLIVVGCSVGGSCALEVAAAAPERVAALVLIGTKARHNPNSQLYASALDLITEQGLEAAWAAFWAPLFSQKASSAAVNAAKEIFNRQSANDIANGIAAFHTRPSRDQFLSRFSGSLTVVSGEDDVAPGVEVSTKQAASASKGTLEIIPECGHYVPLEKPEYLNKILRDVISAHGTI